MRKRKRKKSITIRNINRLREYKKEIKKRIRVRVRVRDKMKILEERKTEKQKNRKTEN